MAATNFTQTATALTPKQQRSLQKNNPHLARGLTHLASATRILEDELTKAKVRTSPKPALQNQSKTLTKSEARRRLIYAVELLEVSVEIMREVAPILDKTRQLRKRTVRKA